MQLLIPLILIAVGSAGFVVLRDARLVLGALLAQWLGVAWLIMVAAPSEAAVSLLAVEVVTALVCVAILGSTLLSLQRLKVEELPGTGASQQDLARRAQERAQREAGALPNVYEAAWQLAIVLTAGVVGVSLASLYPLGAPEGSMIAFYWVVLSGVLALVVDGARNPVKLAAGVLALLTGATLLIVVASPTLPGPVLLGSLAISRVAVAAVLAYGLVVLKVVLLELNLNVLFDSRSGLRTETALALLAAPEGVAASPEETETADGETGDLEPQDGTQAVEVEQNPPATGGEETGSHG
jgi:hypothetical protein